MIKQSQIYKCHICGNFIEVIFSGGGILFCCEQPMERLGSKTEIKQKSEESRQHLPRIEQIDETLMKICVGENDHPMTEAHHIAWIELIYERRVCRKFLRVGEPAEATFKVESGGFELGEFKSGDFKQGAFKARIYCNVHGLWKDKSVNFV